MPPPAYICQAALLALLTLEQSEKVPTPTERPRQASDAIAGIPPQGHAPWLAPLVAALERRVPGDSYETARSLPWLTPSLTERVDVITYKSANNTLTVQTNRSLSFCPGSVLDGVVQPYMVGAMAPNSGLTKMITISITNPRVFHLALHTGSDTGKEYGLHTFPRSILRQLAESPKAKWLVPFTLPPQGEATSAAGGAYPKNFSIRFGAHRDSIYNSEVTKAAPLTPQATAPTRRANAEALTYRHPTPPITEVVFPTYQRALDNLPEEPTPITLPALKGSFSHPEDMEDDAAEQHTRTTPRPATSGAQTQEPLGEAAPAVDPVAAQGPTATPVGAPAGAAPEPSA